MTQEMEVLANINHPNIMRIYELLEDETNYYIVSEILEAANYLISSYKRASLIISKLRV